MADIEISREHGGGAHGERATSSTLASPDLRAVDVLLIEDDPADALLVREQLEQELPEASVERVPTAAAALARMSEPFGCIVLDLQLPDASGLDAVALVRERAPWTPLIVLTGLEDAELGTAAVDAGAQDYLVKGSVDAGALARAIRYGVARAQVQGAERELILARAQAHEVARLERGLVPRPMLHGDTAWMATRHRAGRSRALLGGDFYDAVQTSGRLRLVIGDVCGHGPDEAAIGVCLRSAWRALALAGDELEHIMRTLQRVFEHERHVPSLFTTLCMIDIQPGERAATMVRAGHPPPALICDGRVTRLPRAGGDPPIGLGIDEWRVERVELPDGWTILLYTDGIIEGRTGEGSHRLGEEGLHRMLEERLQSVTDLREHAQDVIGGLVTRAEQLNGGALIDDVAMMLVGQGAASRA
ncbi:MAG TPA: fused response regulator/phosphatase [Solirubrobacteraceae bacterium]|nr:fused response regulator/phosphatase [Solirubrobacteraceae bacterium]